MEIIFYRHWYLDEVGEPVCSGWQADNWWKYKHRNHRDDDDCGDDGVIKLLKIEERRLNGDQKKNTSGRE